MRVCQETEAEADRNATTFFKSSSVLVLGQEADLGLPAHVRSCTLSDTVSLCHSTVQLWLGDLRHAVQPSLSHLLQKATQMHVPGGTHKFLRHGELTAIGAVQRDAEDRAALFSAWPHALLCWNAQEAATLSKPPSTPFWATLLVSPAAAPCKISDCQCTCVSLSRWLYVMESRQGTLWCWAPKSLTSLLGWLTRSLALGRYEDVHQA